MGRDYEVRLREPVNDEELRQWLADLNRPGAITNWEPHVRLRMKRIFARLRELELSDIVDAIEMYVEYRVERAQGR